MPARGSSGTEFFKCQTPRENRAQTPFLPHWAENLRGVGRHKKPAFFRLLENKSHLGRRRATVLQKSPQLLWGASDGADTLSLMMFGDCHWRCGGCRTAREARVCVTWGRKETTGLGRKQRRGGAFGPGPHGIPPHPCGLGGTCTIFSVAKNKPNLLSYRFGGGRDKTDLPGRGTHPLSLQGWSLGLWLASPPPGRRRGFLCLLSSPGSCVWQGPSALSLPSCCTCPCRLVWAPASRPGSGAYLACPTGLRAPRLVPPHIPLLRRRALRSAEPDDFRCLSRERARAAVSPDRLTSLGTCRHTLQGSIPFCGGTACRRVHGPRPLCPLVHGWTPTSPHRGSGKQRCSERGRRDSSSGSRLQFFWVHTPKWDGYIIGQF